MCGEIHAVDCGGDEENASNLYILIVIGYILCGIGASPMESLGYSYIEEFAPKHSAFYIGTVICNNNIQYKNILSYILRLNVYPKLFALITSHLRNSLVLSYIL